MAWSKDELKTIRAELPRAASKTLADAFGMKRGSINNILSGAAKNDVVVLAAIELAKDYQAKIAEAKKSISVV